MIRDREIKAVDYLDQFDKNVQQWFNEAMDRVSGWYKRWTQTILFVVGLFLVIVVNADTVMLVQRFTRDSALRKPWFPRRRMSPAPPSCVRFRW